MKRKRMSMRELRQRMVQPLCTNCGKLQKEHLPVMAPDRVQWRCLDEFVCSNEEHQEFTCPSS
jgi:hypothetical protein